MAQRFKAGDAVRIDIPDETDPDYERLHDCQGEVVAVFEDAAEEVTGDERDAILYRVRLDSGTEVDVRWRDLRPR